MRVAIIGSGVIGSSIALQMVRAGHQVTVIERNSGAGLGSTSSSSAVVRFNYSTIDAVALAWESYFYWKDFKPLIDGTNGYTNTGVENSQAHYANLAERGWLMLDVPLLSNAQTVSFFDSVNIPYEIWNAETLKSRIPGIDAGKYWPNKPVNSDEFWEDATEEIGGIYSPAGGYISDPLLAAQNFAEAARREGATFKFRKAVTSIEKNGKSGRVSSIRISDFDGEKKLVLPTGEENLLVDVIINVAGPWSTMINKMAGAGSDFTVELKPLRQEVHQITTPKDLITGPSLGDLDLGIYMRSGPGGATLVGGTEPECDPMQWIDPDKVDEVNMVRTVEVFESQTYRLARRFPKAQIPSAPNGIVGVYDVASDWTPIYDKTDVPGFYVAIGTSGNQFKNATTVGFIMTELIEKIEAGHDHDLEPIKYKCQKISQEINLGAFSRKREHNEQTSGTVMG